MFVEDPSKNHGHPSLICPSHQGWRKRRKHAPCALASRVWSVPTPLSVHSRPTTVLWRHCFESSMGIPWRGWMILRSTNRFLTRPRPTRRGLKAARKLQIQWKRQPQSRHNPQYLKHPWYDWGAFVFFLQTTQIDLHIIYIYISLLWSRMFNFI